MAYISGWQPVAAFSEDEKTAKSLAVKKKKKFCKDDLDRWTWETVADYYGAWVKEIKEGTVIQEEF